MLQEPTSSSSTGEALQEPAANVPAGTTSPPASEGVKPIAREQVIAQPQPLSEEQIARVLASKQAQAAIYRQAQSMKDKELNQERLRRQQEEEKRRLEGMDDEEFGRYQREQSQHQGLVRAGVQSQLAHTLAQLQQVAMAQISNKAVREQVQTQADAGAFQSFPEFFAAVVKAEAEHKAQTQITRRERQLREAITKEVTAEQVGEMAPQLGTGVPVARTSDKHGRDLLSEAIGEIRKQA